MSKIEIDNKRMWESIIGFKMEADEARELCDSSPLPAAIYFMSQAFKKALNDQGLEWNGKEIIGIEPEVNDYDEIWGALIREETPQDSQRMVSAEAKEALLNGMTDFEQIIKGLLFDAGNKYNLDTDLDKATKELAPYFLEAARKQLQPEFDKEFELAYNNQDEVVYNRGYGQGREDERKEKVADLISEEDIDEMVDNFKPSADEPIGSIYLRGIKDALKFIKGE